MKAYFFFVLVLLLSVALCDDPEEYESNFCETTTLNGSPYLLRRTMFIKYGNEMHSGQYILNTTYFDYNTEEECEIEDPAILNFQEKGNFSFMVSNQFNLIRFFMEERVMTSYANAITDDLLTTCGIDAPIGTTVDILNLSCEQYRFRRLDDCAMSTQPRDFVKKEFIQFGVINETVWCDWETDQQRNLTQFGDKLEYVLTSLERAEESFNKIIVIIQLVLLGISILGALFTIITFLVFPRIRTYPIKLICWLCLTIVLGQTVFIIAAYAAKGTDSCEAFGALVHYFFLANFTWCSCLAFNFYQLIVKRNSQTRELEKYYHLFGWGLPLLFVLGVGLSKSYGPTGGTCYMTSGIAVLVGFFIPGFIILAANFVLFFFVSTEIHGTLSKAPQTEQKSKENSKEFRVLFSIFVTVGLTWLFGFVVAIAVYDSSKISLFIFTVLFTVSAPLQGFFVFIAYCINKKVLNRWKGLFGCSVSEAEQTTSATASGRSTGGATRSGVSSTGSSRMD